MTVNVEIDGKTIELQGTLRPKTTTPPGPVDCVLSEWSAWPEWSEWTPCANGKQTRRRTRTRTVVAPPSNNGAPCGPLVDTQVEERDCALPPQPVDCVLSEWGAWSNWGPCVNGKQTRTRSRTIVTPPSNNGAACGPLNEVQEQVCVPPVEPPPLSGHPVITFANPALQGALVQNRGNLRIDFSVTDGIKTGEVATLYRNGYEHKTGGPGTTGFDLDLNDLPDHTLCTWYIEMISPTRPVAITEGFTFLLKTIDYPKLGPPPPQMSDSLMWVFRLPNTNDEGNSYTRHGVDPFEITTATFPVEWMLMIDGGRGVTTPLRSRLLVNEVPVTDWLTGVPATGKNGPITAFRHTLNKPVNEKWLLRIEQEPRTDGVPTYWCKCCEVYAGKAPAGPQDVWVYADVYDAHFNQTSPNLLPFKVKYHGKHPRHRGRDIKPRKRIGWSEHLHGDKLWKTPLACNLKTGWPRRLNKNKDGWIHIAEDQLYQYWALDNPRMPIYDGFIGHAAHGHTWGGVATPWGASFVFGTQGFVAYHHTKGLRATLIGRRRKLNETPIFPATDETMEHVGIFTNGLPRLNENWDLDWDWRDDPTRSETGMRLWKNLYTTNTFDHCITHIDISPLMQIGGVCRATNVLGSLDGTPGYVTNCPAAQARVNQPWGGKFSLKYPGVYYFSERGNHSVRKWDLNTGMVTTVFRSANPEAWAPMPKPGSTTVEYSIPHTAGPQGTGTLYYPEAIGMDYDPATGKETILVALRFGVLDGCIVRVDPDTQTVSEALITLPKDANGRDIQFIVSRGTIGPRGTVHGTRWGSVFMGKPKPGGLLEFAGGFNAYSNGADNQPGTSEGIAYASQELYPSGIIGDYGFIDLFGTGNESAGRYTARLGDEPQFINAKYAPGKEIYRNHWGMRHGFDGVDCLEGNGFNELRRFMKANPTEAKYFLRSGWGLNNEVPMTDAEYSNLEYYLTWPQGIA